MAIAKKKETAEKRVVFIPKDGRDDNDVIVSVNGRKIQVKKGEAVALPVKYAEVVEHSLAARADAERYSIETERVSTQL